MKASGDYELQATVMELIFRLMSPSTRKLHVDDLFPDGQTIKEAFLSIRDLLFDKDCRIFLNTLNDTMEQRMYNFHIHDTYFTIYL